MRVTMTKPAGMGFDSMLDKLRGYEAGRLIDSFVRVEFGEDFLRAAWDAFVDLGEYFDEVYEGERQMLNQFVLLLEDEVDLKAMGIPVCL